MLLRRVIEHVKSQNWTAVVLDFVIVVVGVFIGIQVSNWNEAQGDRSRFERYLIELEADLGAEIIELTRIRDDAVTRYAAILYLLDRAVDWAPPEAIPLFGDDFAIERTTDEPDIEVGPALFNEALSVETFDGQRHTYDALISTGDFQLFEDMEIAKTLRAYYADLRVFQDFERSHLVPNHLAMLDEFHGKGLWHPGVHDPDTVIAALRTDGKLSSRFRSYAFLASAQYRRLLPLIARAEETKAKLGSDQ